MISTDLDGKRVYLRAWSEESALAFQGGDPPIESREIDDESTPTLMPMTIHSEDGSHMHGMLLERNERIEHPVSIEFGDEEEYAPLLSEVMIRLS